LSLGVLSARYRSSHRIAVFSYFDDPPVGTEVFLGDGLVEVYVGRGVWQTVGTA